MIDRLRLRTVLPSNWESGLAADEGVFVTPPIGDWVLAVGPDLAFAGDYAARVPRLLERLSEHGGEAAWFHSHDDAEHHGWALARDGGVERAYAWTGADGEVMWLGEATAAEHDLGCYLADPRDQSDDDDKWWPDERHVLELAARWTVSPARLATPGLPASTGWLGRL